MEYGKQRASRRHAADQHAGAGGGLYRGAGGAGAGGGGVAVHHKEGLALPLQLVLQTQAEHPKAGIQHVALQILGHLH